jgi:hypothetical protein
MSYQEGLTWEQIHAELDGIDEMVDVPIKPNQEFQTCSLHKIKHRGVAGACPLCMLRTFFEEKERMGADYAEAQGFIEDWRLKQ